MLHWPASWGGVECPMPFVFWTLKKKKKKDQWANKPTALLCRYAEPRLSRLLLQTAPHFQSMFACRLLSFPCCVFRLDLTLCVCHILSKHRSSPCHLTPFCYHCSQPPPFKVIDPSPQPLCWTLQGFPSTHCVRHSDALCSYSHTNKAWEEACTSCRSIITENEVIFPLSNWPCPSLPRWPCLMSLVLAGFL